MPHKFHLEELHTIGVFGLNTLNLPCNLIRFKPVERGVNLNWISKEKLKYYGLTHAKMDARIVSCVKHAERRTLQTNIYMV